MEKLVHDLEAELVSNPTDERRESLLSAQEALCQVVSSAAEQKRFLNYFPPIT